MGDSGRYSWLAFAGGIVLGGAAVGGVAYAVTSHYLSKSHIGDGEPRLEPALR